MLQHVCIYLKLDNTISGSAPFQKRNRSTNLTTFNAFLQIAIQDWNLYKLDNAFSDITILRLYLDY